MRFSKLFLTLLPFGFVSARTVSSPELSGELVQLLEKHNLALVPRSELTDALKELNTLLKSNVIPRAPVLVRRQNGTAKAGSKGGDSDGDSDDGGSRIAAIPGLDGLGDLGDGLKGLTGALGDVKDLFKALGDLLSPEFLQAFHDAMVYLAATLKPPAPNQVRNLLAKAGPLLDLVGELNLKDLVKEIQGVDIAGIVSKVLKLLTDDNLKNINGLLNNFVAGTMRV